MSNVKIRGLPDGPYQIKCPDPIPQEWNKLCETASGDYGGGAENCYYKIYSDGYEHSLKKWPDILVIEYNHWKKCIEDHINGVQGYQANDWIYIIDGGCRCGKDYHGYKMEGKVYQIERIERIPYDEIKIYLYNSPYDTTCLKVYDSNCHAYIRPATQKEIDIATRVGHWKVGDVLPAEWLNEQDLYVSKGGRKETTNGPDNYMYDRTVESVECGWAKIKDSVDWLSPKKDYPTYPGNKQPVVEQDIVSKEEPTVQPIGWKVGNGFKYSDDTIFTIDSIDRNEEEEVLLVWEENGDSKKCRYKIEVVNKNIASGTWIIQPEKPTRTKLSFKTEDGYDLYEGDTVTWVHYYKKEGYTIYPASMFLQQEPVMVTVENAYVGMRVVRGRDWYSMNSKQVMDAQDSNGTVSGTIIAVHAYRKNYVTVNWDNGREGVVYRIGAEDKYDLYQCNKQVTTNNQTLTNNQKQQENATYKRNTEQEICNKQQYTGNIICEEDKENSCTIISSRYYKGTATVYAPIECIIRGQRAIGTPASYRG